MGKKVSRKSPETDERGQRSGEKAPTLKTRRLCSVYHSVGLDSYKVTNVDVDVDSGVILLGIAQGVKGGERDNNVMGLTPPEAYYVSRALAIGADIIIQKKLEADE